MTNGVRKWKKRKEIRAMMNKATANCILLNIENLIVIKNEGMRKWEQKGGRKQEQ